MRTAVLLIFAVLRQQTVSSFSAGRPTSSTIRRFAPQLRALPTVSEVKNDDFMRQLGHTSQLIPLLRPPDGSIPSESETDSLRQVLNVQLSHSEGIRGFFAVYLTSPESLEDVPEVLEEAVRSADAEILVPLACMNVVMPSAMSSTHQDPSLKECAAKTAENGKKILRLLKDNSLVIDNCKAIHRVCVGSVAEDDLTKYWEKFFQNYKYGTNEKEAISLGIAEFL